MASEPVAASSDAGAPDIGRAVRATLNAIGVTDGHLAVTLVGRAEMRRLNAEHRGRHAPTDVLAFPVDGVGAVVGRRELGDVVVCPEEVADLREAVVHGVLHLAGHDHERDAGEMLALQRRILASLQ